MQDANYLRSEGIKPSPATMGSSGSVMKDTAVAVHNDQVAPGDGEVDIKLKHGPDAMDVTTATRSSYMMKTTVETFATRLHASDKFKEIDADGNGFLEKEELDQVAKYVLERCIIHNEEFGIKENKSVMLETKNRIMERVDVNGDGKMDEDEFCDLCEMISSRFLIIARAKEKFDEFDVDGSGEIDKTECIKVSSYRFYFHSPSNILMTLLYFSLLCLLGYGMGSGDECLCRST